MRRWVGAYERFAVLGVGRSGIAAANVLAHHGAHVLASDTRDARPDALDPRVTYLGGRNDLGDAQVVVVSPGLKPSLPIFAQARARAIPIISEVELAFDLARAPMVAITGTDGKTTTTSLAGHMFAAAGKAHAVAGNIGTPLSEVVESIPSDGVIVAEISAFQLHTTHFFHPVACAVTNVAGDHLDYFDGDFVAYTNAKRALLARGADADLAVLRQEDPVVSSWASSWPGRVCWYGVSPPPSDAHDALWSDGERFLGRWQGQDLGVWLEGAGGLPLRGAHNHANMLAAAALAMDQGVGLDAIRQACRTFSPLPHRMQPVRTMGDVTFWDDSKATNAHAALVGLRSVMGSYVAIVGGVDKGLDLADFVAELTERAVAVISIGELRERLRQELGAAGFDQTRLLEADSMTAAVDLAHPRAQAGGHDVVLSPACSSFDMFDSYAHRGEVFQAEVSKLG